MKYSFFLLFLLLMPHNTEAQNTITEQSLEDSVYVYYFDLFDENDVFHWGEIPQNLLLPNYKFCFKNTGKDTLIFNRITTGDGKIHYNRYGTSVVFPGEYLIVQALHNRSHTLDRIGSFDRRLFMSATSRDSSFTFVHAFTGSYLSDSTLRNQKNVHINDSLYPVVWNDREGYQFFEWHDKLKAAELREKQRRGEVDSKPSKLYPPVRNIPGENWYFIHMNGTFATKRRDGRLEHKYGNGLLGTDSLEHYCFLRASKSYYSGKRRITIEEGKTKRYVYVKDWDEKYAVLNLNGAPPVRFNDPEACLEYIDNLKRKTLVRVEIGKNGTLTYRSDIEVKSKGVWHKLTTDLNRTYTEFESMDEPYRLQIRWKDVDSSVWNYDWLYTNRSYLQRFEKIDSNEFPKYTVFRVEGVNLKNNQYRVDIKNRSNVIGTTKDCRDTLLWLLRWYDIPGSIRFYNEVYLENTNDATRLYRALNKHFGTSEVFPMIGGKYGAQYFAGNLTVEFQPGTTEQEMQSVLKSIGATITRREDTCALEVLPIRVHVQMKLGTELQFERLLPILDAHKSIYSIFTRFREEPKQD